jgi:hypothetical protein
VLATLVSSGSLFGLTTDTWTAIGSFAASGSVLVAVIAAMIAGYFGFRSLQEAQGAALQARLVTSGQFLLQLQDAFRVHDALYRSLIEARKHVDWLPPDEDWIAVTQYLGLFERCKILIDWQALDIPSFQRLYSYRLRDVCNRKEISAMYFETEAKAEGWTDFLDLWHEVRLEYFEQHPTRNEDEWVDLPPDARKGGCPRSRRTLSGGPPASSAPVGSVRGD